MAYTDSVAVRTLGQRGLDANCIKMFVSNAIQNLVLALVNVVPVRDKMASTVAGCEAMTMLNAMCKAVSDQERGLMWIPRDSETGLEGLRAILDM